MFPTLNYETSLIKQLDLTKQSPVVGTGSLLKTNRGYLFMSVALSKINVDGTDLITLSLQSPLGQKLASSKIGVPAEINGTQYIMENVL